MKSFYSLIKITLNDMSNDSLTIGMLLSTPVGLKLQFSKSKIHLSKSLLPIENSVVDFLVNEIQAKVEEQNNYISDHKNEIFELKHLLDSNYFTYLSKYSNGLLQFTAPNFIADSIDDSKFNKLFVLLVDNFEQKEVKDKSIKDEEKRFFEKIDIQLTQRVKDKVHTNYTFDNQIFPSLFNPFQIDCIGLNGIFVGAKALPFWHSKETLQKNVNSYINVIANLSITYNKQLDGNKFFLIADEPKNDSPNHALWQQLFKERTLLTVINSDESEKVAELIEKNHSKVFIS